MEYTVVLGALDGDSYVYPSFALTTIPECLPLKWLNEEIGDQDIDWEYSLEVRRRGPKDPWEDWHRIIRFKREEDKVKFILKWM